METEFATALRKAMRRPTHVVTPGWLSKCSGIPKGTIINWLEGRAGRPRSPQTIVAIGDALRLTTAELNELYAAAGFEPLPSLTPDALVESAPVGLYATTLDGHVLHANATLVRLLGYASLEHFRRVSLSRDVYVESLDRHAWVDRVMRYGTLTKDPVRVRRADGAEILLLDSATLVRDGRGGPLYFVGVWEPE